MTAPTAWPAARLFDGDRLHEDMALLVSGGRVDGLCRHDALPAGYALAPAVALIAPGFLDLQVNGGDGLMLGDCPTAEGVARIAQAHCAAGSTAILPTLISNTPERTRQTIDAVAAAVAAGVPGVVGLHLEGPHFCPARAGAHRADLLRPMTDDDLRMLRDAAARLPLLKITLSPLQASPAQIAALAGAGVLVSLGHSDAPFEACAAAAEAGARCVTHLYNAMSQLAGRSPGLVGAALGRPGLHAGLIADGHHVHPAAMRLAATCLMPAGRLFLVTDAMAVFGTDEAQFALNGRTVCRAGGCLRLADGTLAGADLTLPRAVATLMQAAGVDLAPALATVTAVPARVAGLWPQRGALRAGSRADFLCLDPGLAVGTVVCGGDVVAAGSPQSGQGRADGPQSR